MFLFALFVGFESWSLRFYTPVGPGNGFFPLCLAVFLTILSISLFCQATFGRQGPLPNGFIATWPAYRKMGAIAFALIMAIFFLEDIGFCLTMFLFYLFLLKVLGKQNWLLTVAVALAGSFGMYFVFVHWLFTPLPVGILSV